jgi:hypothetical protein
MVKKAHALLVRQSTRAFAVPELAMACDAAGVPSTTQPGPFTLWHGMAVIDGQLMPYPVLAKGSVSRRLVHTARMLVNATHVYAIVDGIGDSPSVWMAAPVAALNVGPGQTTGVFRKKLAEVIFTASQWQLDFAVLGAIDPTTRQRKPGDAGALLVALGGAAQDRLVRPKADKHPLVALRSHGDGQAGEWEPALDSAGELVVDHSERVLWSGRGGLVASAMTSEKGSEIKRIWSSVDSEVSIMLTDERLMYRVDADARLESPIETKTMVDIRPPASGTGRSLAGQIRHSCPSGISNGDASGLRLGRPLVTVTMMDFPGLAVWAALIDPRGDGSLADRWAAAVADWRLRAYPAIELDAPDAWSTLTEIRDNVSFDPGKPKTVDLPVYLAVDEAIPR